MIDTNSTGANFNPKLRTVLYIIHRTGGGTPAVSLELARGLKLRQRSIAVVTSPKEITLEDWSDGEVRVLLKWFRKHAASPLDVFNLEFADWLQYVLYEYSVDLVHIRHTFQESLRTYASVIEAAKVPLVLSIHDYYYLCPGVNLIDSEGKFCDGKCTVSSDICSTASASLGTRKKTKTNQVGLQEWRQAASTLINLAEALVFPSYDALSRFSRIQPSVVDKSFVIEHGRSFTADWTNLRPMARQPGPMRIVLMANWAPHKGVQFIRKVMKVAGPSIEWHVLGEGASRFKDHAVIHGPYNRNELPSILRNIDPDYAGFFSICAETFSHSLSEAWKLGIPAIVGNIGAPRDRVEKTGAGFVCELPDPQGLVSRLMQLSEADHITMREKTNDAAKSLATVEQMSREYEVIYSRALVQR